MNDVMIDIETLGTSPASAILSIAAVEFSRETGELQGEFCLNVNPCHQSRHICTDTLKWWAKQPNNALDYALSGELLLFDALRELASRLPQNAIVWSQGIDFDFGILEHAYTEIGWKTPWAYNAKRDTRTLYDAAGLDTRTIPREGTHHNALDDCKHQIRCVVAAFNKLKGNP